MPLPGGSEQLDSLVQVLEIEQRLQDVLHGIRAEVHRLLVRDRRLGEPIG